MAYCDKCGDEIEFRYIDGNLRPIHIHGGWCSGSSDFSIQEISKPFQSRESYTNPNALCPVCGKAVFFYQSPEEGRVFFDDLGWPWPKHPCTDNPRSQNSQVKTLKVTRGKPFVNNRGNPLTICRKIKVINKEEFFVLIIKGLYYPFKEFRVRVMKNLMHKGDVRLSDLEGSPSFIAIHSDPFIRVSFISSRRKKIINMKLSKAEDCDLSLIDRIYSNIS